MPIVVVCPSCGKSLKAPDTAAGKNAKCGSCGTAIRIPGGAMTTTADAPLPPAPRARSNVVPAKPVSRQELNVRPAAPPAVAPQHTVNVQVVTPAGPPRGEVPAVPAPTTKPCPFCGEPVLIEAKKCKHCHETIDVALRAADEARRHAELTAQHRAAAANSSSAVANTTVVYQ